MAPMYTVAMYAGKQVMLLPFNGIHVECMYMGLYSCLKPVTS